MNLDLNLWIDWCVDYEDNKYIKKWDLLNHMSLLIIRHTISRAFRYTI